MSASEKRAAQGFFFYLVTQKRAAQSIYFLPAVVSNLAQQLANSATDQSKQTLQTIR
jgi:hypothetical protein